MPLPTYPADFFRTSPARQKMGYCFILMPFDPEMHEVFDTIRDSVEGEPWNFQCQRADDFFAGGHILTDVLRGIQEAQILVADLTGRNPNVFYELGIAHMVKLPKDIILLTQDISAVPFDLQSLRCIQYEQTIKGAKKLREDLRKALGEVAGRVYRFQAKQGETFQFANRLFGDDNCLYDFSLSADYFGDNAATFMLGVRCFVPGIAAPENFYNGGHRIRKGDYLKVPKVPWELRLDDLAGDTGQFSVVQCPYSNPGPKIDPGGVSVARGEASFWESVEASQLPTDWKKRLRSFVENAASIPGCYVSWNKGALVNLPGSVPQKALVGVRRDGILEVYLARWRPSGNTPLTAGQEKKKSEFLGQLQTVFGMNSEELNKQYPQLSPNRWLPKTSELEAAIRYLARPEDLP